MPAQSDPADVERMLVNVEHADGLAEAAPDAVVVDAGGHRKDEHLVRSGLGRVDDLFPKGREGLAVALLPDYPSVHSSRHDAEGRKGSNGNEVDILFAHERL